MKKPLANKGQNGTKSDTQTAFRVPGKPNDL